MVHLASLKPVQAEIFNNACKMLDDGNPLQAFEYINQ